MAWMKLESRYPRHPKMLRISLAACWLDVCGIAYATEYLTDGFVPEAAVKGLDPRIKTPYILAAQLVETGRWEKVDGGYQIHDYLVYNPSAAEARAAQEEKVTAGRAGGQRSAAVRQAKYGTAAPRRPTEALSEAPPKRVLHNPARSRNEARIRSVSDSDSGPEEITTPECSRNGSEAGVDDVDAARQVISMLAEKLSRGPAGS